MLLVNAIDDEKESALALNQRFIERFVRYKYKKPLFLTPNSAIFSFAQCVTDP